MTYFGKMLDAYFEYADNLPYHERPISMQRFVEREFKNQD